MAANPDTHIAEGGDIRPHLTGDAQESLLRWLEEHQPSAHSDVGNDLLSAVRAEGGEWLAFSPSWGSCRYVAIVRSGQVCALAHGQQTACFRVRAEAQADAIALGGRIRPELGEGWLSFEMYFRTKPAPDLRAWMRAAYGALEARSPEIAP